MRGRGSSTTSARLLAINSCVTERSICACCLLFVWCLTSKTDAALHVWWWCVRCAACCAPCRADLFDAVRLALAKLAGPDFQGTEQEGHGAMPSYAPGACYMTGQRIQ